MILFSLLAIIDKYIWRADWPMRLIVSSIILGVSEQNNIVNKCGADNWTAESTIIASNVN